MHWRQRRQPGPVPAPTRDPAERQRDRQGRREAAVAAGLRELRERCGHPPTHQALAEHSGLPIGWLRWAYPSLEDVVG
jgi:DNA-binding transcriptional regulator YbjK